MAIACVGGGSNALGLLHRFIGEPGVRLAVAEAAGEGIASGRHAAALLGGTPGILHGSRSYMLQDPDGQVIEAVSISAGLDYPGIGPQLSALMEAGRLIVASATDDEAVAALRQVATDGGDPGGRGVVARGGGTAGGAGEDRRFGLVRGSGGADARRRGFGGAAARGSGGAWLAPRPPGRSRARRSSCSAFRAAATRTWRPSDCKEAAR